jgi:hypothetical protein
MKKVEFRPATREDARYVAARLRDADREEVVAMGSTPQTAVEWSRLMSDFAWTGLIDGEPSMIFGCGSSLISTTGEIWALGTNTCTSAPREMLVYGRYVVSRMLEVFPALQNYCDARYTAAHRWLKKLGFTVHPAEPHGPNGELFCKIEIHRREQ